MTIPQSFSEQLDFDSTRLPAEERFERYRALYAVGADAQQLAAEFSARVRAWRLDRALLFERRIDSLGHRRDAGRVAGDGFDHVTLTLVRAGTYELDTGEGFRRIEVGQAVLVDTLRPMANRMYDAHVFTISMAREWLTAITGPLDGLHGVVMPVARTALLLDYVVSLTHRVMTLSPFELESATEALGALARIAIGDRQVDTASVDGGRRDATRMARVRQIVEERLADPGFGPADIVTISGISRSTLYRLFHEQGGIAGHIQERRLDRVRLALIDGSERRSFAEIAFANGFISESHCSRLFRDRFGSRPGEYRSSHAVSPDPDDPVRLMIFWQDEVR